MKAFKEVFIKRFLSRIKKTKGCWYWKGRPNTYGYGQIKVDRKPMGAHRFSYTYYIGKIKKGFLVCHTCDNRLCVNPKHLWQGTEGDNARDCVSKGRQTRLQGVQNGQSRLTEKQVFEIRESKIPSYKICSVYGVAASTIRGVRNGRLWKHL